jgi:ribosomal protein S18 acetylase RimI-like enzyme
MLAVRAVTAEDKLGVARVHVRAWQAAYRGIFPDDYLDQLRPEDRAVRYTFESDDPSRQRTFVAADGATICGFVTAGVSRDHDLEAAGEIYAIYVDPGSWSIGAGRLLIESARLVLTEMGFSESLLWVLEDNQRAKRFYVIDGWLPDGSARTVERRGVQACEIRNRRPLL